MKITIITVGKLKEKYLKEMKKLFGNVKTVVMCM